MSDILNYMENPARSPAPEFLMEVTDKTRADVKVLPRCIYLHGWLFTEY